MWFHPINKQILFTKNDKEDPRMGEFVQIGSTFSSPEELLQQVSATGADFHILGYADDEGIALNGGRIGAAHAPQAIRTALYKMTPALQALRSPTLQDWGDLNLKNVTLAERHERARTVIRTLVQNKKKFLSFGGGHDYGYADAGGFLDASSDDAVVINFDAHLDVRPSDKGFHSGTPFYRMLCEFSGRVNFVEVGLQKQCNSQTHFRWAQEKGATLLTMDQLSAGLLPNLQNILTNHKGKKLFISLDMDAFSSTEAPGCSQSWTTGLRTQEFFPALAWLSKNFEVQGLGIYEVSPPLDFDNHTSKLAALIAHAFIFNELERQGLPT